MFRRGRTGLGVALALTAARWEGARGWAGGLLPRVMAWLGIASDTPKCDYSGSIDPNGCPKKANQGSGASKSTANVLKTDGIETSGWFRF